MGLMGCTNPRQGTDLDSILTCLEKALRYSVRTGHPRYFDKLCHGSESVGEFGKAGAKRCSLSLSLSLSLCVCIPAAHAAPAHH
jgi:hypothetical protein